MQIAFFFCSTFKPKLKPYFRLKFFQVKIPLLHFIFVGYSLPNFINGGIIGTFNNKWLCVHNFLVYVLILFFYLFFKKIAQRVQFFSPKFPVLVYPCRHFIKLFKIGLAIPIPSLLLYGNEATFR